MGDHFAVLGDQEDFVTDPVDNRLDFSTIRPDTSNVALFRYVGITPYVHRAARLVDFHIGTVGHIERSVQGHIHFVVSLLLRHFLVGRAVTPDKLILTVNNDVGVNGDFVIDIAVILVFKRHTHIVGTIDQELMRSPRPVSRFLGHALLGKRTQSFASLVTIVRKTRRETKVKTHTRRRLDRRRSQRNREIVGVFTGRCIVGIVQTLGQCVTHQVTDFVTRFARLVEARFVVCLTNIDVDQGGALFDFFRLCGKVHTQGQAIEGSRLVIVDIQVEEVQSAEFVLVSTHAKVVPAHRRGKLEHFARLFVGIRKLAITFDHVVVSRLFLKSANLYVVELDRNTGNIRVARTAIEGIFSSSCMGNGIPVHLGFVFTVRRVPHDFGAVAEHITNRRVHDLRTFHRIERRKAERRFRRIDHVLERKVIRIVGIQTCSKEVVGRTVLKAAQDNFVLHARGGIIREGRRIQRGLVGTVIKPCRSTSRKLHHHDCGVHAHVADFHRHPRGCRAVKLGGGKHTRAHDRSRGIDTGFGQVIVFPALVVGNPGISRTRSHATEKGSHRRIVLVTGTRRILTFGVCSTVVRVGIVLVADPQDKGHIPRVHAQHVVQLVDTQLMHFVGLPVRSSHNRENNSLLFNILRHIGVRKNFEDVACLVTVVNPGLVRHHRVPSRIVSQGTSQLPSRSLVIGNARQRNRAGSISRHVFQVQDHARNTVFHSIQPFRFGKTILGYGLVLVSQDQLVKSIGRIGISIRPARVLHVLQEALVVGHKPTARKGARTVHIFLASHQVTGTDHVVSIFLLAGRIEKCHRSESQVIVEFVVTVVSRRRPTGSLGVVHKGLATVVTGLALGKGLRKVIHLFGNHQAAVRKGLVVFSIHLAQNRKAGSRFATDIRTDFTLSQDTRRRTATARCGSGTIRRELVLVFRSAPPAVVLTETTNRQHHVVNHALCTHIGTQHKVCTMLCFAQHIRDTVGIHRLAMVKSIVVFVGVGIRCSKNRRHHKGIHLRL